MSPGGRKHSYCSGWHWCCNRHELVTILISLDTAKVFSIRTNVFLWPKRATATSNHPMATIKTQAQRKKAIQPPLKLSSSFTFGR
jgi:hypothetical protein